MPRAMTSSSRILKQFHCNFDVSWNSSMNMWFISVPIFSKMNEVLLVIILLRKYVVSASRKRFSLWFSSFSVFAMVLSSPSWWYLSSERRQLLSVRLFSFSISFASASSAAIRSLSIPATVDILSQSFMRLAILSLIVAISPSFILLKSPQTPPRVFPK